MLGAYSLEFVLENEREREKEKWNERLLSKESLDFFEDSRACEADLSGWFLLSLEKRGRNGRRGT